MWRRQEPVLITSAAEPRQEEIRRRQQRYILTMLVRVVLFVLAVVAFTGWLRVVAVGLAVILPWIAVVVANGGPPRSDRRQAGFVEKAPAVRDQLALEPGRHVVVDAEVVEDDPLVTEPVVTEPLVTEPLVTEPLVTEPLVTEPVLSDTPGPVPGSPAGGLGEPAEDPSRTT